MIDHAALSSRDVFFKIRNHEIVLAGNKRLKIFGKLHCSSGKRMKKQNRIFFTGETEALAAGYRRCKKCFPQESGFNSLHINAPLNH